MCVGMTLDLDDLDSQCFSMLSHRSVTINVSMSLQVDLIIYQVPPETGARLSFPLA